MRYPSKLTYITSAAIVLCLLIGYLFAGCSSHDSEDEMQQIEQECAILTRNKTDFNRSDSLARILLEYGRKNGDYTAESKALYYLGVYNGSSEHAEERHSNLERSLSLLQPQRDDSLILKVYNALGIYEVIYFQRFSVASLYFLKSMEMARKLGDEAKAIVAEQNLSSIMITSGDTLGINYDLDIYRYAKSTGDSALLLRSAFHCGIFYSQYQFNEEKALFFANELKGSPLQVHYHKIMAYIAMEKNDWERANAEMKIVLKMAPDDDTAALNYAYLLNKMKRYVASNSYIDKSEELHSRRGVFGPSEHSARLRADNYAALGDMRAAYEWEKEHSSRLDSIQKLKQKEEVVKSRILFDTEKKERLIALQKVKARNLYITLTFVTLIFLIIVIGLTLFIRRRNQHYRQSTERIRMMTSQEKAMRDILNQMEAEVAVLKENLANTQQPAIPSAALHHKKEPGMDKCNDMESKLNIYDRIFSDIVREIIDKEGYKDLTLSRDVLSERVGCSHTYISETIKSKTGMSYSSYLNSVRVNEAVRILSEGTDMSFDDLAHHVGFLSLKTFYTSFKEFVGVPPGKFRSLISENTNQRPK